MIFSTSESQIGMKTPRSQAPASARRSMKASQTRCPALVRVKNHTSPPVIAAIAAMTGCATSSPRALENNPVAAAAIFFAPATASAPILSAASAPATDPATQAIGSITFVTVDSQPGRSPSPVMSPMIR